MTPVTVTPVLNTLSRNNSRIVCSCPSFFVSFAQLSPYFHPQQKQVQCDLCECVARRWFFKKIWQIYQIQQCIHAQINIAFWHGIYRVVVKSVGNLTALKINENVEARKQNLYQKIRWSFKLMVSACFSTATVQLFALKNHFLRAVFKAKMHTVTFDRQRARKHSQKRKTKICSVPPSGHKCFLTHFPC